jgi:hypothetical protein
MSEAPREETVAGYRRRVWRDLDGHDFLESFTIAGMGHGVPLAAQTAGACGKVGAFHLEAGICSTRHIARFWGLLNDADDAQITAAAGPGATRPASAASHAGLPQGSISEDTRELITQALKQAGLLGTGQRAGMATSTADPRAIIESTLRSVGLLK